MSAITINKGDSLTCRIFVNEVSDLTDMSFYFGHFKRTLSEGEIVDKGSGEYEIKLSSEQTNNLQGLQRLSVAFVSPTIGVKKLDNFNALNVRLTNASYYNNSITNNVSLIFAFNVSVGSITSTTHSLFSYLQGISAYEVAVNNGYAGTQAEWLDSLIGYSAFEVAQNNGYVGTEAQWLDSLIGDSAYEVAVNNGFVGSQAEWLVSLMGDVHYELDGDIAIFKGTQDETTIKALLDTYKDNYEAWKDLRMIEKRINLGEIAFFRGDYRKFPTTNNTALQFGKVYKIDNQVYINAVLPKIGKTNLGDTIDIYLTKATASYGFELGGNGNSINGVSNAVATFGSDSKTYSKITATAFSETEWLISGADTVVSL